MNHRPDAARRGRAAAAPALQAMGAALRQALAGRTPLRDDVPALLVEPAALPSAPELLARRHPGGAAAQREAKALYLRCLAHYRQQVQRGLPQDDLGAAAAFFLLANLAALQDLRVSQAELALVERQMRGLIGSSAAWQASAASQRQALFEQLALLGVLVGESQAQARTQGASALANVRRAARGYVEQLLGLDPAQLELTAHGLALRTNPLPAQSAATIARNA